MLKSELFVYFLAVFLEKEIVVVRLFLLSARPLVTVPASSSVLWARTLLRQNPPPPSVPNVHAASFAIKPGAPQPELIPPWAPAVFCISWLAHIQPTLETERCVCVQSLPLVHNSLSVGTIAYHRLPLSAQ